MAAVGVIGHREWTSRKTDPVYSMSWRRQCVAAFRPSNEETFMAALSETEQREMLALLRENKTKVVDLRTFLDWCLVPDDGTYFPNSKGEVTKRIRDIAFGLGIVVEDAKADRDQIAAAVERGVAAGIAAIPQDLGPDDAKALAREVLSEFTRLLDNAVAPKVPGA